MPIVASILPTAHVAHYLWVFYLLPVVIVVGGILRTVVKERQDRRRGEDPPDPS